jgi:hypothetical protein
MELNDVVVAYFMALSQHMPEGMRHSQSNLQDSSFVNLTDPTEKLTVTQLDKFPAFHGTRRFIIEALCNIS